MAKLRSTSELSIAMIIMVMNLEKWLRDIFSFSYQDIPGVLGLSFTYKYWRFDFFRKS